MRGLTLLALSLSLATLTEAQATGLRRFTVEDSIALSSFVPPGHQFYQTTPRVIPSPDNTRLLTVTLRGDLASHRRVATFWIFDRAGVEKSLHGKNLHALPRAAGTWGSASNQDPVSHWRWSSDGASLLFLGADDEGVRRLIRMDAATGATQTISPADQDVTAFQEQAGKLVFLAHQAQPQSTFHIASANGLPDAVVGAGQSLLPMVFPHEYAVAFEDRPDFLWKVQDGSAQRVGEGQPGGPIPLIRAQLVLSPDGERVLTTTYVRRVPASWERYLPSIDEEPFRYKADPPGVEPAINLYRPQQYSLVRLSDGASEVLVDAPIDMNTQFQDLAGAWSPDGSRVAVVGSYAPLNAASAERPRYCELGVVEVASKGFECLIASSPKRLGYQSRPVFSALRWSGPQTLESGRATPNAPDAVSAERFSRGAGGWSRAAIAAGGSLTFAIREAIDQRPLLMARTGSAPARAIFDPNPQLAAIDLGEAVPYAWRDAEGTAWSGALVRPPAYDPKRRYPLVIQTHNLDRGRFLVDGPSATGFAARALAARDMLVLQVDEPAKDNGTPKEASSGAAGYRAAIRQLADEGHIDASRVGIITWSHMDSYAMQALVDEPHAYAAATFAEAAAADYPIYLMNIDYMGEAREKMVRAQVGPKPFGEGLKTWMTDSQGFHLDRVCTPVLFQANEPTSLIYGWSVYAALRAQAKPVDLLYLRTGAHVLVKPQQRLLEQGMNVDWYDFWLNGRTDPAPEKREQYARWSRLRAAPRCGDASGHAGATQ